MHGGQACPCHTQDRTEGKRPAGGVRLWVCCSICAVTSGDKLLQSFSWGALSEPLFLGGDAQWPASASTALHADGTWNRSPLPAPTARDRAQAGLFALRGCTDWPTLVARLSPVQQPGRVCEHWTHPRSPAAVATALSVLLLWPGGSRHRAEELALPRPGGSVSGLRRG